MRSALIVGVGEALGSSVCRNLAQDHHVGLVARSEGCIQSLANELPSCEAFRCDVSDPQAWAQTLDAIEEKIGISQRIIYNTEGGGWGTYDQIDEPNMRRMLPKSPASHFIQPDRIAEKIRALFAVMLEWKIEATKFAAEIRPSKSINH